MLALASHQVKFCWGCELPTARVAECVAGPGCQATGSVHLLSRFWNHRDRHDALPRLAARTNAQLMGCHVAADVLSRPGNFRQPSSGGW
jgi:hypothetical protein